MGRPGLRLVGVVLALVSIGLGLVSAFSQTIGLQQCGSLDLRLSLSGCLRTFEGQSPAYSPSQTLLAVVSASGTSVELWRIDDGTLLQTFETGSAYALAFSPDETLLAVGTYQAAQLWDVAEGTLLATLPRHAKWVMGLAFSPDGRLLATGATDDPSVRVWRTIDGMLLRSLEGHRLGTAQVLFSPDGGALAATLGDGTAAVWRTAGWRPNFRLTDPEFFAQNLVFAPDSRSLLLTSGRLVLRLLGAADGSLIREMQGDVAAFSPDGTVLATAGGGLRLWRVSDGAELHRLEGHGFTVEGLAFSPDGSKLASAGGYEGTVRVWRVADGALVRTIEVPNGRSTPGQVTGVRFLMDGTTLVSNQGNAGHRLIRIWSPDVAVANLPKWLGVLAAIGFGLSLLWLGLPESGRQPRPLRWAAGFLLIGGSFILWGPVWLLWGDVTNYVVVFFGFILTLTLGLRELRISLRQPRRHLLDQLSQVAEAWGRR